MGGDNIQTAGDDAMRSEQIAENTVVKAIARMSMTVSLPIIGLIAWLAGEWLDGRFQAQAAVAQSLSVRVDRLEDTSGGQAQRLATLERVIQDGRADRLAFQREMREDFNHVRTAVVQQSNTIAALTATLQTLMERERKR